MAYINLLPWREAARNEEQKQYLSILTATAMLSFLLILLLNLLYTARVDGQIQRNSYLEKEISILDQRIAEIRLLNDTKKNLQQRMLLIEQLQSSRNLGTQIIDAIARSVPAGVHLTQLEKRGSSLLLIGKSESNNRLSGLLRQAEKSALLSNPLLEFIETDKDNVSSLSNFKMQLKVESYEAVQETTGSAATAVIGGAK